MNLKTDSVAPTTKHSPVRIKCDGAKDHQRDMSAVGIVYKSHSGRTIDLIGQTIGSNYTTVEAEIEAIVRALDMVSDVDAIQHVTVLSDCTHAIHAVEDRDLCGDDYEQVSVEWIPREDNTEADWVADRWVEMQSPMSGTDPRGSWGITD